MNKCQVTECTKKSYAKQYCNKHYLQMRHHGKIIATKYDKRPHVVKEGYALIPLGIGGKQGHTLVDIGDAWIDKYFWQKHHGYVTGLVDGRFHAMSRLIMQPADDLFVDHINGDRLDNRRNNLRICTQQENNFNKSMRSNNTTGYKGVVAVSSKLGAYKAQIKIGGKYIHLGLYKTALEAAKAYDKAARELYGEFAKPNSQLSKTETG